NVARDSKSFNSASGLFHIISSIDYRSIESLTVKGGGSRVNTFNVGDGTHNLDGFPADLSIEGGGAGDSLARNDRGAARSDLTPVSATYTVIVGNVTRTESAIGHTPLFDFQDTVTVSIDYIGIGDLTVQGGSPRNSFLVGDGTHNLDFLPAHVSIQGGN